MNPTDENPADEDIFAMPTLTPTEQLRMVARFMLTMCELKQTRIESLSSKSLSSKPRSGVRYYDDYDEEIFETAQLLAKMVLERLDATQ